MIEFPRHKCGLYLSHNEHRDYHETAREWIEEADHVVWESKEAKQRAIETDEIWNLQWYPNTPIGFYIVAAPTLAEVLKFAMDFDGRLQARSDP